MARNSPKNPTPTNAIRASADEARPPQTWQQRWVVASIGIFALLVLLYLLSGASWPSLVFGLLRDVPMLALWLIAAAGYGSLVGSAVRTDSSLDAERSARRTLHAVTRIALGLGILGLLQLALGLAGFIHPAVAFSMIALGVALFAIRQRPSRIKQYWTAEAKLDWLWLIAALPLAAAIVAAYVPPGILWGDEPHGYDVLEYHLQIPREWFELGRITPLTHNVFSFFPQGMEIHYLLAMQLRGGPWHGMYLAQLMHVSFMALAVVAAYAVARTFASKPRSIAAALAVAYVPWTMLLAPVAYNEAALLLYATLAIGWILSSLATNDSPSIKPPILAGAFAGLACGAKLTAVPQLLVVLPILLMLVNWRTPRRILLHAVVFVAIASVVFSPWLIRNTIWTHNPVFPEAQSIFGRAHFTPEQTERWTIANHLPGPDKRSTAGRLGAIGSQIFGWPWISDPRADGSPGPTGDWRFGYILIPTGILAGLFNLRRREAQLLLGLIFSWLIFWTFFTHLQGRFFTLAIPVCALLIASLTKPWMQRTAGVAIIATICLGLNLMGRASNEKVFPVADNGLLSFEDFTKFLPDDVQAVLPQAVLPTPDHPIALVGDAKAFLYPIPTARLRYRTVFDVDAQPAQPIVQAWLANQTGSPIVIVDPAELARFARTYTGIPPMTDDFPGPRDHTFVLTPQNP